MSRKNRKPNSQAKSTPNKQATNTQKSETEELSEKADELSNSAMAFAIEADLGNIKTIPMPETPDLAMLKKAVEQALQAEQLFKSQISRSEKQEKNFNEKNQTLAKREDELSQKEQAIKLKENEVLGAESNIKSESKRLNEQQRLLLKQEETLKERELNAEAGFAKQCRESLATLEQEAQILRDVMSSHRSKIAAERAEFESELEARRSELETDYQDKIRSMLDEQLKHKRAKDKLEIDAELLEEDRNLLNLRIDQGIAQRVTDFEFEIQRYKEQAERIQSHRDTLQNQLSEYEEASRRIGTRSPEQLYQELQETKQAHDDLYRQLQTRPDAAALERLQQLTEQQAAWQQAEFELKQENNSLKRQVARNQIAVLDLETLCDEKRALASNNDLLKTALDELRKEVDERIRRADNKAIFPACTLMDEKEALQDTAITDSNSRLNLKDFVEDLRQRVAYDSNTGKELFYSERDMRSFIAGLAMSHLHLLQGISGTGKTSLPLAVARAIGAGSELIEVQSGWRDKHDLIGHFNAFERRFYESEFLQAIYKAQCPQYKDRLFFVILDEMNLSHPEQYFADLLSALEQDPSQRRLTLMESEVDPVPQLFIEGRKLNIPENIWFIGTANHDETTVNFAPKTYDRSHVMELPRHQEHFEINRQLSPRQPIAWDALEKAFENARKKHAEKAKEAYNLIEQYAVLLDKRFHLGWGNRLQRQMDAYVPVVIEAGGSLHEAVDHIFATKLLRKLKDRYDNRPEYLNELKDKLQQDLKFQKDTQSIAIIDYELHRLGEGV